ncbi:MAG: hypothetical protein R3F11_14525 [Verrucomicrobiales bacterium]
MPDPAPSIQAERRRLQRGIAWSAAGAAALLAIAIVLASAAAFYAYRSHGAESEARERLWDSLCQQARAERLNKVPGSKARGLDAVRQAAAIRPSAALRDDALALVQRDDITVEGEWDCVPEDSLWAEFSPDLDRYLIARKEGVTIYRTSDRAEIAYLPGIEDLHLDNFHCTRFSRDGRWLAARYQHGYTIVWDLAAMKEAARFENPFEGPLGSFCFSWDSRHLCLLDNEQSAGIAFDPASGEEVARLAIEGGVDRINAGPDGRVAVSQGSRLIIAPLGESGAGGERRELAAPARITRIAWHPDGERVAYGCDNGSLFLADLRSGTTLAFGGHESYIWDLDFSADGSLLCSTSWGPYLRLWDTASAELRIEAQEGTNPVFSPDGERVGFVRPNSAIGIWKLSRRGGDEALARRRPMASICPTSILPGRYLIATEPGGRLHRIRALQPADRRDATGGRMAGRRALSRRGAGIVEGDGRRVQRRAFEVAEDGAVSFGPPAAYPLPEVGHIPEFVLGSAGSCKSALGAVRLVRRDRLHLPLPTGARNPPRYPG